MMDRSNGKFVIAKACIPGTYEILNTAWIVSAHTVTCKDGTLTVVAKNLLRQSFIFEGSEAIDLLSAMGISAPGYHPGSLDKPA